MSEDDENLQAWIEPELEARVVAAVLGEASAFELAELERIIAEKPELAIFRRRIEAVHGLMASAVKPEAETRRLSAERRQKLLTALGQGGRAPGEPVPLPIPLPAPRLRWGGAMRALAGVAAVLLVAALLASIAFPSFTGLQKKSAATRALEMKKARMLQELESAGEASPRTVRDGAVGPECREECQNRAIDDTGATANRARGARSSAGGGRAAGRDAPNADAGRPGLQWRPLFRGRYRPGQHCFGGRRQQPP